MDIKERHIPETFFNKAAEIPGTPFLGWKENGSWKTMTWGEAERKVRNFALGLISLGLRPGGHAAIFSPNRPEWGLADLAILSCGAVDVPIYATNSALECEYILNDSKSRMVVVAGKEHFEKIRSVRDGVEGLSHVITMERLGVEDGETVLHMDDVIALGEDHDAPEELERRLDDIAPLDLATLIYTSGTTGPPKGVMLTHKNFLSNVYQASDCYGDIFKEGQMALSFLPLSHSMERTGGWYFPIYLGGTVYYSEDTTTIVENMKELRPDFLISVPRLFEKIYNGVHEKLAKASPLKKSLFSWALGVGKRATVYRTTGKSLPAWLSLQHKLAERLIFSKIRTGLGADRLVMFISGGGPLAREINEFFHALGLWINEGYGLSETTPIVCLNTFKDFRFGSVGKAVLDTELRIAPDGEILIKGPQVMKGYYNKPEATRETFDENGWFKTGDIGEIHDGFLSITDRKKELFITAGGKNISPQNLERAMIIDPYIETIVSIGDGRPFISALIVPDFEALANWARERNLEFKSHADLIGLAEVQKLYEEAINAYNDQFARVEQIKKFRLIDHSFSQETGELTPTMKLKRKIINELYKDQIEEMYSEPKK